MAEPFTLNDAITIEPIVRAAITNARVRYLGKHDQIISGTARCIGDEYGNRMGKDTDIREQFLRITTDYGMEAFLRVDGLMEMVRQTTFVVD